MLQIFQLYVFILAGFVGFIVIQRVPPLLHTPLMSATNAISGISIKVGPGESAEVTFTAPTKPGKYVFLCSFAGHWAAGMTGDLIVK